METNRDDMDTLYIYTGTSAQPVASVTTDAEGALYVIPHQSNFVKDIEAVVFGVQKPEMAEIIAACRTAGYEATNTLRAPLERREATTLERREARFLHESNLIEGVTERTYEEVLTDITGKCETGHAGAWKLARLLAKDRTPLTQELVLEMHRLLTDEQVALGHPLDAQHRGHVRDILVEIGGAVKPVPTIDEFAALILKINEEIQHIRGDDVEALLNLAAKQHLAFENMHPFVDGNGRIGRILVNYVLAYFQHPPLVIMNRDKEDYYACFPEHAGPQEDMGKFFVKKYI